MYMGANEGLTWSMEAEGFLGSDICPLCLRPMKTKLATRRKPLHIHTITQMTLRVLYPKEFMLKRQLIIYSDRNTEVGLSKKEHR